ncbi:hypothetical protein Dsin_020150 [Dipteronia sinensis]|uniref:Uncharacterized protein n=1 Tax=Dipteronia sinensis TaxID=43782 RepID=A0AAE0A9H8_9ROSI|nr:hypothetical protein Dsin_020150 [Dipteronia sinensis]
MEEIDEFMNDLGITIFEDIDGEFIRAKASISSDSAIDRTLFVAFSKGHPITKEQLSEYFFSEKELAQFSIHGKDIRVTRFVLKLVEQQLQTTSSSSSTTPNEGVPQQSLYKGVSFISHLGFTFFFSFFVFK